VGLRSIPNSNQPGITSSHPTMAVTRLDAPRGWVDVAIHKSTLRYPLIILTAAALVSGIVEHATLGAPSPLLARLSPLARLDLYKQVAPMAATGLGFLVASVAILVSLDPTRKIVCELRTGEAFRLLVANLLAACLWLLVLALLALAGWMCSASLGRSGTFMTVFEVIGYAAVAELLLGGSFFGLVTYKVAKYD
jgi:hypothetical protein